MPGESCDEVAAPDDDARLGAAEEFVAAEGDECRAIGDGLTYAGFVAEPLGWRVEPRCRRVDEARARVDDDGCVEAGEFAHRCRFGEPDHPVVRRVHLEGHRRVGSDHRLVVGESRAVRGADLDESGARFGEDLRHPETTTDLDQFAARHDDLTATRERSEHEQHGRRIVVHDDSGFGPDCECEEVSGVVVTRAPTPGVHVVFEVHGAAGRRDGIQRVGCEWCSPEVGVQQHAGRVVDGAEQSFGPTLRLLDRVGEHRIGPDVGTQFCGSARRVDHGAGDVDGYSRRDCRAIMTRSDRRTDRLDAGQGAPRIGAGCTVDGTFGGHDRTVVGAGRAPAGGR